MSNIPSYHGNSINQNNISHIDQSIFNSNLSQQDKLTPLKERSMFIVREKELEKQHSYYKKSKVDSCSYVFVRGGAALAVPFYSPSQLDKLAQEQTQLIGNNNIRNRSTSVMHDSYLKRHISHAGERNKPLEPYSMNAQRSRLLAPEPRANSSNHSTVVLADPFRPYKRTFVTTSKLYFDKPDKNFYSLQQNEGILSDKIKYQHIQQNR